MSPLPDPGSPLVHGLVVLWFDGLIGGRQSNAAGGVLRSERVCSLEIPVSPIPGSKFHESYIGFF